METFKNYIASLKGHPKKVVDPFSDSPTNEKWDVVLFAGKYDPITKEEIIRIREFINEVIKNPEYNDKFSENPDIGLLSGAETEEDKLLNSKTKDLTLQERQFLTGKFFGLKLFACDFKQILYMAEFKKDDILDSRDAIGYFEDALRIIMNNFEDRNILIVIDPIDGVPVDSLNDLGIRFEDQGIKIGFMEFKHKTIMRTKRFGDIPITGELIKSLCIMDYYKPSPQDLKFLCHKFNIGAFIKEIRSIHFLADGENFLPFFMYMFPEIKIYRTDSSIESNYKFMFELLKKLYLKDEYESEDEHKNTGTIPDKGTEPGIDTEPGADLGGDLGGLGSDEGEGFDLGGSDEGDEGGLDLGL